MNAAPPCTLTWVPAIGAGAGAGEAHREGRSAHGEGAGEGTTAEPSTVSQLDTGSAG